MKTLKLKKMGWDFYGDKRTSESDCTNYRLRAENIIAKTGEVFGVDFAMGYKYAFLNKKGEKLKNPKIIEENHLSADAWHYKIEKDEETGLEWKSCFHFRPMETEARNGNYHYNLPTS